MPTQITAEGKHVVVLGGGDTGADCIGTAHRQGAASVTNLAIGKQPPARRAATHQPWPMTPTLFEVSSAHEEGGRARVPRLDRRVRRNDGNGRGAARCASPRPSTSTGERVPKAGTEREIPADLVLLALGFTGPEQRGPRRRSCSVPFDERGNVARDGDYQTDRAGRLRGRRRGPRPVADRLGDRGGPRSGAPRSTRTLKGETELPAPVRPTDRAILV